MRRVVFKLVHLLLVDPDGLAHRRACGAANDAHRVDATPVLANATCVECLAAVFFGGNRRC